MTNDEIKISLKELHKQFLSSKKRTFWETINGANILLQTIKLIEIYESEIERLSKCVKTEDEVRAIMKSQMDLMGDEMIKEQFSALENRYIELLNIQRDSIVDEFSNRLCGIVGSDSCSIQKPLLRMVTNYIANDIKNRKLERGE